MRVSSEPIPFNEPTEIATARRASRVTELASALQSPDSQLPGWVYDTPETATGGAPNTAPGEATGVGLNPTEYLHNLSFEGALMLVMLDRLQGIQHDLNDQVGEIMRDNAIKRLFNDKMTNLNTMLTKARAENPEKDTSDVTFTIDKSDLAVGSYQVTDVDGKPALVESGSKDARGISYTENSDGTVTVKTKVADINAAIDKIRCSIDSLTTTSETKSVRLQFLVQTKNSLVSLLTQTLNTAYETSMAPVKNIRVG
jgi:hypothetical protein